jgi:hypothetical protein
MRNEKLNKLEKIDEKLRSNGERLIEFSEDCNKKFQSTREHVIFNKIAQQNIYPNRTTK